MISSILYALLFLFIGFIAGATREKVLANIKSHKEGSVEKGEYEMWLNKYARWSSHYKNFAVRIGRYPKYYKAEEMYDRFLYYRSLKNEGYPKK
jgi:hypothetical protein